ncbi:FAD/NAD(P)-binding protein [Chlorobium phaeobacteroides]|uniref:Oxidoreductase FAD/NAD(P)-binding domain protein n=1 Tax=Chlorobium phaeobacteroides (strain DSM 266 / SMG 266 / 2430) TaxID=290317 RepID=A1BIE5_CHLPD|nr:FAD/NAD(P)-binding protein [Chlorobium phaeobacteroides]ABL66172.1 oxidoreductase FAD/NAD(P)-binding domain protein [Chlorobium phaeobacteroides DSM 266]MBV5327289.1 FAD/NAD(P)-binding protein [Chlorobium sp.]
MKTDMGYKCRITNVVSLTEQEKLFQLHIVDPQERRIFRFKPGQFIMLELPGYGDVPISISSSYSNHEFIELCIRKAGHVTSALFRTEPGMHVAIRGPFGSSFPMDEIAGHHVLLVAGGLGIAPLRAPLFWINEHRDRFRDVHLLYGAREPSQLLFSYQFDEWNTISHVRLHTIVEHSDETWKGRTGMITELFRDIEIDTKNTYAIVCGPPIMFKFVCSYLDRLGIPMNRMFVSLERRMHCGMGKCCRCMVGSTFTCIDGPVFDYWSVMNLKEAI